MFNKAWINLAILLLLVAILFDVPALLVISVFLLIVVPMAWWWAKHSLKGVTYERALSERRAFAGETVELTLGIANEKLLPLGWLAVEDRWSSALPLQDGHIYPSPSGQMGFFRSAFAIRWFERINRRYRLRCTRRGFYPFGPAHLRSGDIWGLFRWESVLDHLDWLIVFPQVLPLDALGFPPKEPLGETKAEWRIFEDPSRAVGIRDLRPEDGFRRIHWKASARRQALQVKVFEPTTSRTLVVFLNVATFVRYWEGTNPLLLEKAIAVAASVTSRGIEDRYLVGLMANGSIPHSDQPIKVLPSRRPDQLSRVLEALAAVTSFTTSTLEALLLTESPRLPWGATLVVVTAIVTEDLLSALVRLHDEGRRVVLVSLEEEPLYPASLPQGITVHHLPASQLPFDESLLGEPGEWEPEMAPPLHLVRGDE